MDWKIIYEIPSWKTDHNKQVADNIFCKLP